MRGQRFLPSQEIAKFASDWVQAGSSAGRVRLRQCCRMRQANLPGTLACLECRTDAIHDCGDHHIIVGEVETYRDRDDEPLLFYGGNYAAIESG